MGGANKGAAGSPVGIATLTAADTVGAATEATAGDSGCEAVGASVATKAGAGAEAGVEVDTRAGIEAVADAKAVAATGATTTGTTAATDAGRTLVPCNTGSR